MTVDEIGVQDDAFGASERPERVAEEFDAADVPELHYERQRDGRWHMVAEGRGAALPGGVEHGSARAVRLGCSCKRCLERAARMRKRGWRL